ncbi:conserved hypothetical protein [Paenibacillus curdlanolyticus YK9]|uniref:Uncharacterized protein n=1 Tax=Paenibacillus curdlanolyticus YK9 TaxID=717606 RepID=E0I7T7_9BACL|nr:conserved hypothetical protein [Paenibacillus curdlanolyticus YK9]
MSKAALFIGMVLIMSTPVISRFGVELNDFVHGIVTGVGVVGCVYGLAKTKLRKNTIQ